jgi:U3 small nucleolar RNA-associated protein 19
MIASFIKRLVRCTVTFGEGSSTQDLMFLISFIVNLLKRHPRCVKLIHRREHAKADTDPYDSTEEDPLESKAIKSSLWEL